MNPTTEVGRIIEYTMGERPESWPALVLKVNENGTVAIKVTTDCSEFWLNGVRLDLDGKPGTARPYPHQMNQARVLSAVMTQIEKLVSGGHLDTVPCEPQQGMLHPQAGSDAAVIVSPDMPHKHPLQHCLLWAFNSLPPEGGTVILPDQIMEFSGELPDPPTGVVFKGGPNTRFVPVTSHPKEQEHG